MGKWYGLWSCKYSVPPPQYWVSYSTNDLSTYTLNRFTYMYQFLWSSVCLCKITYYIHVDIIFIFWTSEVTDYHRLYVIINTRQKILQDKYFAREISKERAKCWDFPLGKYFRSHYNNYCNSWAHVYLAQLTWRAS